MSNHRLTISIVLCTYNNADSLAITLEQVASQKGLEPGVVELIVVDNNSPDHTRSVFQRVAADSPVSMHYLFEARQGLSHARNTGVEHANGEHILFTDDDAEIPDTWVAGYIEKIKNHRPDCLYSKIGIIWDKPIPWWYSKRYTAYFVGLDYGNETLVVTDIHKEFFGKNFCVKRDLLTVLGGFDPALGRNGSKLIAGEETLLYRKLIKQKRLVMYFPDSPVGHRLKDNEYSEENIRKKFVDGAYSSLHIASQMSTKNFLGRPLGLLIRGAIDLVVNGFGALKSLITMNKKERFYYSMSFSRTLKILNLWMSKNHK